MVVRVASALRRGALMLALAGALPLDAWADCRPRHPLRPVVARTMGPCGFDPELLSFAGTPAQQAACLLRPIARLAKLGPVLTDLPPALADRVGRAYDLPAPTVLSDYLSRRGLEDDFAAHLWQPVARANDDDPAAPQARYLVIHDTSGPYLRGRPWPDDLDTGGKINNLAGHRCEDGWESAHVIINRAGAMLLGHELAVPWRATKFERALNFNGRLKGLFLHVEMIQPRRREWGAWRTVRYVRHGRHRIRRSRRATIVAPVPGFTSAQYDRLALVYTIAGVRAGRWLIPAFHAVIDGEIPGGHDDPQNFALASFTDSLERLLDELHGRGQARAALAP